MKKLVLDAESLAVESFEAAAAEELHATVHAREATADDPCELSVAPATCDSNCPVSAYETCSRFCWPTADCP